MKLVRVGAVLLLGAAITVGAVGCVDRTIQYHLTEADHRSRGELRTGHATLSTFDIDCEETWHRGKTGYYDTWLSSTCSPAQDAALVEFEVPAWAAGHFETYRALVKERAAKLGCSRVGIRRTAPTTGFSCEGLGCLGQGGWTAVGAYCI